ncbi:MAG: methyltransferase domain-containing protein [Xanthobacteraceae bacterium]|nr:methyltransferase domain-containing protein [Xanthobacteraceae bacterium]PWB59725.1 MAG: methyltransferase type 11 [Bradyrhizobiaceae bacterium]
MTSSTPQAEFWRGDFGNAYTDRNVASPAQMQARLALWSEILSHTISAPPATILEVGANLGINLRALRLLSSARCLALEPNDKARAILVRDGVVAAEDVCGGLASEIPFPDGAADLAFTSGVLIHIHPDHLAASLGEIHRCARRWIACVEYFSDKPETIPYRGHEERLFKRDFGGLWMDTFPDLRIVAYGFAWKRVTGLDNLTWWLFEKP